MKLHHSVVAINCMAISLQDPFLPKEMRDSVIEAGKAIYGEVIEKSPAELVDKLQQAKHLKIFRG